ncbi:hypothetical protein RB598_002611 [Gaeumannomyces tritici]
MVQALQTDKYWSRVWVLQEIGRARKLRVCFGSVWLTWGDFTKLLTLHNCDSNGSGPLWLDLKLRVERQHTLKQLLQDHQRSDCSEPRDRVYGLLGLASDASGFPVDYKKSLMTIWEDTMIFLNAHELMKESAEIIRTGQLVKGLLMSRTPNPLAQVMPRTHMPEAREGTGAGGSFHLQAVYLGSVVHVGSSVADFVAKLSAADAWDAAVQDHFRDSEGGEAHHMRVRTNTSCHYNCTWTTKARAGSGTPETEDSSKQLLLEGIKPLDQGDSRLILIKNRPWWRHLSTEHKMGVASNSVLAGDSVFWVEYSRRALLARLGYNESRSSHTRIVGTALTAEDLVSPCEKPDPNCDKDDTSSIYVDAMTIFTILE